MTPSWTTPALLVALTSFVSGSFASVADSVASPVAPIETATSPAAKYFAGLDLVDQDGRSVDLYADLMENRTVVIHSFFARCTASCPVMMTSIKAIQTRLADRIGRDVALISISIDPTHDTPMVLKEYAGRLQAGKGWYFMTGSTDQVNTALKRIGQYAEEPESHMDLIVVGNLRTGLWKKLHGLAKAKDVVTLVEEVADDAGP